MIAQWMNQADAIDLNDAIDACVSAVCYRCSAFPDRGKDVRSAGDCVSRALECGQVVADQCAPGIEAGAYFFDSGTNPGDQFFCPARRRRREEEAAAHADLCRSAGIWLRKDFQVHLSGVAQVYR